MASRVLGFMRDIFIARFLGTSGVAEAFLIAFSLPNMFRRFFAEGAFNMAFVPMYAKKLEGGEDADDFAATRSRGYSSSFRCSPFWAWCSCLRWFGSWPLALQRMNGFLLR